MLQPIYSDIEMEKNKLTENRVINFYPEESKGKKLKNNNRN